MRLLAFSGVLAVALWLAGTVVVTVFTDLRGSGASPEERLAYFHEDPHRIFVGGFLFQLGSVSFVFFVGGLRARLVAAEGGVGALSGVAYGGGIATAITSFGLFSGHMLAALERDTIPAQSADALARLSDLAFQGAQLFAIPLLVACALVALRTATLPRAYAWLSIALGVSLAVPHTGWASLLYGFPVWVLATSVLLARRGPTGETVPPP